MTSQELRAQIPFLSTVSYLDSASVVPASNLVLEAMNRYAAECPLNYGVGEFPASKDASARVDAVRKKLADFIHADAPEEIVFTKNTTEAINMVAYGGPWEAGDEVILTSLEHQSNFMPWLRLQQEKGIVLKIAQADLNGVVHADAVRALVSPKTKLINVTYVSNIYGTVTPVEEIGEIARAAGAYYMIDAAQSGGRLEMDVSKTGCDFMAICGRKSMMGPQGTGALYIRAKNAELLAPMNIGSRAGHVLSADSMMLNKAPYRYEAGVLNTSGVIGLGVAVDTLAGIGMDEIFRRNSEMTQYMIDGLLAIPQVELYGGHDASTLAGAISWNVKGHSCSEIASRLGSDYNVAVASGAQGALLAIQPLNITGVVRTSVHYFTSKADIDALLNGLKDMLK